MRGGGLLDAVEFDDDDALQEPGLIGFRRRAPRQKPPASRLDRRTGELGVARQSVGIRDRTIGRYPVGLGHCGLLSRGVASEHSTPARLIVVFDYAGSGGLGAAELGTDSAVIGLGDEEGAVALGRGDRLPKHLGFGRTPRG